MFNKQMDVDLWLNYTTYRWEYKSIILCESNTFGLDPLETNVKFCFCFSEDKTQGYSSEYLRLTPLLDGFTELYEYPNLKQIISELNFIDAKFQVEEHQIIKNLRGDLRDILMLDCNFGLLYDEPVYLLNQFIKKSQAL